MVAACADAVVATDVKRYFEAWHGERPEQCRALLAVLEAIDDPAAERAAAARRAYAW